MLDPWLIPRAATYASFDTDPFCENTERLLELDPQEQALVVNAVSRRQAEFADGRWCAHQALSLQPGANAQLPIGRGKGGMPLWPDGFCGSISHIEGFRAAVVAPLAQIQSIGFDCEPSAALPSGVFDMIARPEEMHAVAGLEADGLEFAQRLLFCAKEATYKVWFPLTQRWLGFHDVRIEIRPNGLVYSYPLVESPVRCFSGRWVMSQSLLSVLFAAGQKQWQHGYRGIPDLSLWDASL